jgi:hypothetical protein
MNTTVTPPMPATARAASKKAAAITQAKRAGKDWRRGVGVMRDTALAREADRIGDEWRRAQGDA